MRYCHVCFFIALTIPHHNLQKVARQNCLIFNLDEKGLSELVLKVKLEIVLETF